MTLIGRNDYPNEPGRKTLYVYKYACGLAFTCSDAPVLKSQPPGPKADTVMMMTAKMIYHRFLSHIEEEHRLPQALVPLESPNKWS